MALVDVHVMFTDTGNELPDTLSVTTMVALKLADKRFGSIWKFGLSVPPGASSNVFFVQLSTWLMYRSALLTVCFLMVF